MLNVRQKVKTRLGGGGGGGKRGRAILSSRPPFPPFFLSVVPSALFLSRGALPLSLRVISSNNSEVALRQSRGGI